MGWEIENANRFGELSEAKLKVFEKGLGERLPQPYRNFLLLNNGGCLKGARRIGEMHHVYGIHDGPDWAKFHDRRTMYGGLIPERLLPIADDPFGNQICISLAGADRGAIYFWNHERAGRPEDESLTLLAPDFDKYLRGVAWKIAVARKRFNRLRRALAAGLDPNAPIYGDQTLLDLAVRRGSLRMVKMLVRAGARIPPDALTEAVRNDAPNTIRFLLSRGANVNYADPHTGFTPLMLAASVNHEQIARLLLSRGADASPKNRWGKSAADLAHTPELKRLLSSAVG